MLSSTLTKIKHPESFFGDLLLDVKRSRGFPGSSVVKNLPDSAGEAGEVGLITGLGRFPRGGSDNPLLYSSPENSEDRGARWTTVHEVTKSQTQLSTHALMLKDRGVSRDFLGGPVAKILSSQCRGPGFNPWFA